MKFKIFLFIVILLVASACGGTAESAAPSALPTETPLPAWPEFTSEAGSFVVNLPSAPVEQVQAVPSEVGDIDIFTWLKRTMPLWG